MTEPLIRVRDLAVGFAPEEILQEHLTFDVERGDVFVVLGGSGSGKSTLLRVLVGLAEPLRGEVHIQGASPAALIEGRPTFGVMFQSGALIGSLTVAENVALALERWTCLPSRAVTALIQAKLRLVGLLDAQDKLPSELSGGMKKRAAIARSMVLEPSLLFLDEPSAGLDPVTAAELDDLILSLNRALGLTLVVVSHDLASILKIGTNAILLDKEAKGIIASGAPRMLAEQREDARVVAFFHRTARGEHP